MKRYINGILIVLFAQCALYAIEPAHYTDPSDYSVVNDIKRKSDLTQNDVEKWKLVWLGSLQNVTAAGIGGYSMYKAGQGASQLAGMAMAKMNIVDASGKALEGYGGLLTNKWFWALAGAAGIGAGAYKFLYPRVEDGILKQINAYADMCENLDVVKYWYSPQTLGSLGTSVGNASWATTNNIARLKGVQNLLAQAEYALGLLDQLQDSPKVKGLRSRVAQIKLNLLNNEGLLKQAAQYQLQERDMHLQAAQKHAHLQLTQEQASALRIGKISLAATAMSNFFHQGLKTLVYINDNKSKIAGGVAIVTLPAVATYFYIKAKLGL